VKFQNQTPLDLHVNAVAEVFYCGVPPLPMGKTYGERASRKD
jgi:hypothetical protein